MDRGTYTMRPDAKRADIALAVMETISESVTIAMGPKGWYMRSVTPAMETMAIVTMAVDDCPDLRIGVNVGEFRRALALTSPDPAVTVGDGSVIVEGNGLRRRMPTEVPEKEGRELDLDAPAMFAVPVGRMQAFLKAIDPKKQTAMIISASDEGVTIDALDDVGMGLSAAFGASELPMLVTDGAQRANYAVVRWQEIFRVLPKDAVVTVSFGSDYPVEIVHEDGGLKVRWLVAPRIVDE